MAATLSVYQRLSWLAHLAKALTQQHHRELLPLLRPLVPRNAVVFDVGAHAGQFAKLFARLAPEGTVYAFEPARYARSILGPVRALHGRGCVRVVPLALGDSGGTGRLTTPLKRRGGLGFGLAHMGEADPSPHRAETVVMTTMDRFAAVENLTRLDFVKADIEGYEARMVRGGAQTLARFKPVLMLEVSATRLARAGDRVEALFGLLASHRYRAAKLAQDARDAAPVSGACIFAGDGDYLFLPPGH